MSSEKLKLLYEYHDANVTIEENLNENKEKVKKYKISGIFQLSVKKNRNGRIYSRELWEKEVKKNIRLLLKAVAINRLCKCYQI